MSGKTHLCVMLAGLPTSRYHETCGTHCLKTDVNGVPWHIWDTPAYQKHSWPAESVVAAADIVVVCCDGTRGVNPCECVQQLGPERCIIALTRTCYAGANLSYVLDYLKMTTLDGSLVPIVPVYDNVCRLVHAISRHSLTVATVVDV